MEIKKYFIVFILSILLVSCGKTENVSQESNIQKETKQEIVENIENSSIEENIANNYNGNEVMENKSNILDLKLENDKLILLKNGNSIVIDETKDDGFGGKLYLENYSLSNSKKYISYTVRSMGGREVKIYDINSSKIVYSDFVDTYNFNLTDTEFFICRVDGQMEGKVSVLNTSDFSIKNDFKGDNYIYECKNDGKYSISNDFGTTVEEKNINF